VKGKRSSAAQRVGGLGMRLARIVHPAVFFLIPLLLSFAAWLVPGESLALRGFQERPSTSLTGIAFLAAFYAFCFGVLCLGYSVGRSRAPNAAIEAAARDPRFDVFLYRILTVIATVGVVYALVLVSRQISVLDALLTRRGNALTESLGGVAGLATLRYTSAVAAPIAIHLWRRGSCSPGSMAWNCLLLAVNTLFTSRLSLMMAVVVYVVILYRADPERRVRLSGVVGVSTVLFGLLAVFNVLRNARFYEANGVDNPLAMNAYQILAYLAAPSQVSLGVAPHMLSGRFPDRSDWYSALEVVTPTFLLDKSDAAPAGLERYSYFVSIQDSLTTNSAFADTFSRYGWWGLLYVCLALGVAGFLYGHLVQYRCTLSAAAGVLAYGMAEFWRIFLFAQGIVVYLLLIMYVAARVAARRYRPADVSTSEAPASQPTRFSPSSRNQAVRTELG